MREGVEGLRVRANEQRLEKWMGDRGFLEQTTFGDAADRWPAVGFDGVENGLRAEGMLNNAGWSNWRAMTWLRREMLVACRLDNSFGATP